MDEYEPPTFLDAVVDVLIEELKNNRVYGRHEGIHVTAARVLGDEAPELTPDELVEAYKARMRAAYGRK
jgi:hypothetical protein